MSSSIFRSKYKVAKDQKVQSQIDKVDSEHYFNEGYYNILMLNVDSFTGGVKGIWEKAQTGFIDIKGSEKFTKTSTGDSKIEIVSFPSSVAIALQRGLGGFSKKVAQGEGPFIFTFRRFSQIKHRTYLQIDGQFIRFTHPMKVTVEHSRLVPRGKIKVLRKNTNYEPYMPN